MWKEQRSENFEHSMKIWDKGVIEVMEEHQ